MTPALNQIAHVEKNVAWVTTRLEAIRAHSNDAIRHLAEWEPTMERQQEAMRRMIGRQLEEIGRAKVALERLEHHLATADWLEEEA